MQEQLKKNILFVFICAIVMIVILFFVVQFIPLYEQPAPAITKDVNGEFAGQAEQKCIALCQLHTGDINYENGPCLSDKYSKDFTVTDWVCDIAHNPRTSIDDIKDNQCKTFIDKKASHFVEVDTNCNLIKKS